MVQVGEPAEVYRRPRNRFVAQFLGATNILSARMCAELRMAVANGEDHRGMEVAIRPHSFELSSEKPPHGVNIWQADVEQAMYLGGSTQYRVRIGELRIEARAQAARRFEKGASVWVHVAPADCLVLNDKNGGNQ